MNLYEKPFVDKKSRENGRNPDNEGKGRECHVTLMILICLRGSNHARRNDLSLSSFLCVII